MQYSENESADIDIKSKLRPDQVEKLDTFRSILEKTGLLQPGDSIGSDDRTLLRFLRARNFDLKKSQKMFRDCQAWRKDCYQGKSIDTIYDEMDPFNFEQRELVYKYWPMAHHRTDKVGRSLNIQALGSIDVPELKKAVSPEHHWRSVIVQCEALTREVIPACRKESGHQIEGAYCIVDLKGFSVGQFLQMKDLAQKCFQVSQDYYPETMSKLMIINAPLGFGTTWKVVKRWLAKETVAKINILGSDYQAALLDDIPAENLPTFFGGKCSCPEGCYFSGAGPWRKNRARDQNNDQQTSSNGQQQSQVSQEKEIPPIVPVQSPEQAAGTAPGTQTVLNDPETILNSQDGKPEPPKIARQETEFYEVPVADQQTLAAARPDQ